MALTYDELDAHVRDKYVPILQDQLYYSNPVLAQLTSKSKVVYDSGAHIRQPVLYGEENAGWYRGLDEFNIATKQTTTLAVFNWALFYVNITIDGETLLKVEGDEKVLSILGTKMDNAGKTFGKQMEAAFYADQGVKAIRPFTEALAGSGTTYAEISKTDNAWWRGGYTNTTGGAFSMSMLETGYSTLTDGPVNPDLIITTPAIYDKIWLRVQPAQRGNLENAPGIAKVGYTGISFNKATVLISKYCPAGYIFLLNTDYWKFVIHRKRNMTWTEPKVPLNQDAYVRQLLWAGALCCVAPRWSGYISNVS
jgi:hypothetical protein